MTCSDPCVSFLREQGYRLTPQRLAILRILRSAGSHAARMPFKIRSRMSSRVKPSRCGTACEDYQLLADEIAKYEKQKS